MKRECAKLTLIQLCFWLKMFKKAQTVSKVCVCYYMGNRIHIKPKKFQNGNKPSQTCNFVKLEFILKVKGSNLWIVFGLVCFLAIQTCFCKPIYSSKCSSHTQIHKSLTWKAWSSLLSAWFIIHRHKKGLKVMNPFTWWEKLCKPHTSNSNCQSKLLFLSESTFLDLWRGHQEACCCFFAKVE